MAEEITKTVENVDRLFDEVVVNGERHVTARGQARLNSSGNAVPQATTPVQDTVGQYIDTIKLNSVLHSLKDTPLSQQVVLIQQAINSLQQALEGISAKIPSEASSSNQLADKSYVYTEISDAVNELDVAEVGGNGKYIKSIRQVDGKIEAVEDYLSGTGGGVAFVGTRAEYEVAKLIPLGQTGHIPSDSFVIITDEDAYIEGEER